MHGLGIAVIGAAASASQAFGIDCMRSYLDMNVSKNVASAIDTFLHGLLAGTIWAASSALHADTSVLSASWLSTLQCLRFDKAALLMELQKPNSWLNSILCAVCASALDIDHFVAAGSFTMHGAMNLPARPFGHSVTFAVTTIAVVWALTRSLWDGAFSHWPALLFVAWGSHQLRDAVRRGLWFWPVGSTQPVPYALYLLLIALMPSMAVLFARACRGVPLLPLVGSAAHGQGLGSPHKWLDKHAGFNQAWQAQGFAADGETSLPAP